MKILPRIRTLSIENNTSDILCVKINESEIIKYKLSEDYKEKLNIAQDLVDNRAFGTLFLYLNENFKVITDEPTLVLKENIKDFYDDCDKLLEENITIVEEIGKPLTEIEGYPIFESDCGILRGSGKKKIKEYFKEFEEVDLQDVTKEHLAGEYDILIRDACKCPECETIFIKSDNTIEVEETDVEPYSTFDEPYNEKLVKYNVEYVQCPECGYRELAEDFPGAWVSDIPDSKNAKEIIPDLDSLEEEEGTQTTDIAPKVDQDLGITKDRPEKKHYDILLGNYNRNEIDESVSFKGFLKNSKGQYQRGNYILVKEGEKYLAIHKDRLKESEQLEIDEKGLPVLPSPYIIKARDDNRYQITSIRPYNLTEYGWAISVNDDINSNWKVIDPETNKSEMVVGWDEALNKLKEIDSSKKARIDRT